MIVNLILIDDEGVELRPGYGIGGVGKGVFVVVDGL
jgi:hypothetical protein